MVTLLLPLATTLPGSLVLLLAPAFSAPQDPRPGPSSTWEFLLGKYDADGDGRIARKEYTRDDAHWSNLDADGDGFLVASEVEGRRRRRRGRGDADRAAPVAPKVGQVAPGFELEVLPPPPPTPPPNGKPPVPATGKAPKEPKEPETLSLASFRGKRPVALIFGSYT